MHYSSDILVLFYDSLCSSALACVAKYNNGDCEACVAQSVVTCVTQPSSSIEYHRIISLTQSVGAMLWSMAQLRTGQLRMVVYVVGSC